MWSTHKTIIIKSKLSSLMWQVNVPFVIFFPFFSYILFNQLHIFGILFVFTACMLPSIQVMNTMGIFHAFLLLPVSCLPWVKVLRNFFFPIFVWKFQKCSVSRDRNASFLFLFYWSSIYATFNAHIALSF